MDDEKLLKRLWLDGETQDKIYYLGLIIKKMAYDLIIDRAKKFKNKDDFFSDKQAIEEAIDPIYEALETWSGIGIDQAKQFIRRKKT